MAGGWVGGGGGGSVGGAGGWVGGGGGGSVGGGGGGVSVGTGSGVGVSAGGASGVGISAGGASGVGVSAARMGVSVGTRMDVLAGKMVVVVTPVDIGSTVRMSLGVLVGVGVTRSAAGPQARAGTINIKNVACNNKDCFII